MIKEIRVSNYALLERIEVTLSPGFNVLTGSTGTGKSIIINALSLLLGDKGDIASIRKEADKAIVEGVFSNSAAINQILNNYEIPEENELIIRRIINRKGGGRVYINGSIANIDILKSLGNILFDIHGQHEHQLLINEETHIDFLDYYGKLMKERKAMEEKFKLLGNLKDDLSKIELQENELANRRDLYEFQRKELECVKFSAAEYQELKEEKKKLDNFEEINELVEYATSFISDSEESIQRKLSEITSNIKKAGKFDKALEKIGERLGESDLILQDASLELDRYKDSLNYDRMRLSELESIVDKVETLKRKYNKNYEELLNMKEDLSTKIFDMESLKEKEKELKDKIAEVESEFEKKAQEISDKRKNISKDFEKKVEEEIKDLGFEKAHFKVEIKDKKEIDGLGKDEVRFLFEPNVGEGWNQLSSIASGGELSRVMLGLKSILSEVDRVEGLVFDEIDVGIGGSLAKKVGEKMKEIGKRRQVLCVTHLPSIAAEADFHLTVEKKEKEGRTITSVKEVTGKDRVEEIARMISGETSIETARKHAAELLSGAN
ncbi:DNA repair protein RecN [candidate division WOR-3 bacterium]|nr:DNA repair protein RecN [candidate division WOR-3 bacterium]